MLIKAEQFFDPVMTNFSNKLFTIDKKEILDSNGRIHDEMLNLLELRDL